MTSLTVFMTNTVGSTLATTYQLSATHGVDNTNVTQTYTRLGTATGWGEVTAQGTTGAWAAAGAIGSPSGKGFMLESSVLNLAGNTIAAGSWSATIRFGIGHDDGTLGGTIVGDIHVRVYRYRSGTYTQIIDMVASAQTIPTTSGSLISYTLSGSTGAGTDFISGDLLYVDCWLNVTSNVTADTIRAIRLNRLSTNNTGDTNAQVVTPGYAATPPPPSGTGVSFVNGMGMLAGYIPAYGGSL
jgi:hypothetical protein